MLGGSEVKGLVGGGFGFWVVWGFGVLVFMGMGVWV